MDYDDNDFQSQNLHLAGEKGNNFPPVLQPYALPKFDFDDSLQGSLRFDSLVETEVFLGIESNEDNQWIEDFSRGSSEIQFSSAAAESCSISRRNNVWSEATSSESVEMLLKSVGQEEIDLVQTNNRESDACDELSCIIKKMEPNLKNDNLKPSDVGDNIQPMPCEIPENFAMLNDDVGQQRSQVEDSALTNKGGMSADGTASDLPVVGVEARLLVTEGSVFIDDKCNNVNQRDADNMTQGGSVLGMQHDCTVNPVQNISTGNGNDELNNENVVNHIKQIANDKTVLGTESGENQEQKNLLSQEAQMDDHILHENVLESDTTQLENPLYSASVEPMEEAGTVASNFNVEEASCKVDSGLPVDLRSIDPVRSKTGEVSLMGIDDNTTSERNEDAACDCPQLDKDLDSGASLLSTEFHKDNEKEVDGIGNSHVDGNDNTNLNVICSSADVCGEAHDNRNFLPSMSAESTQKGEKNIVDGCGDVNKYNADISIEETKSAEFSCDGSRGDATAVNKLMVSKLRSYSAAENISGDGIIPDVDVTIDCKDAEISPLLGFSHLQKEEETAKTSSEACSSDVKTCSSMTSGLNIVSESGKGSCGPSGQMLSESANESPSVMDAFSTENQSELQVTVIKEVGHYGTKEMEVRPILCDSTANKGDGAIEVEKGSDEKESSKVVGEHLKLHEPTVNNKGMLGSMSSTVEDPGSDTSKKGLGGNEAVVESRDASFKKVVMSITNEYESNANLDKAASGSPLIINTELPQNVSNKEDIKGLPDQAVSVADVNDSDANKVSSVSQDLKQIDVSKDDRSFTFEVGLVGGLPQKEAGKKGRLSVTKQTSKVSLVVDGSRSTPGLGQSDPKIAQDISCGSPMASDVAIARSSSKGNSERKPRRASGKSAGKETTKKGTSAKEKAAVRLGDKVGNVSLSPSGIIQLVQSSEMQRYGHMDSGGIKPFVLATSTSSLPDLNSSASQSLVFQQPFTDLQQVQLRAQIFVYGALIQGTAPDEAYMISAFGGPDGRNTWENAWRLCMERLHGQKSHLSTPETPLQSHSGVKAPEQAIKQNALQHKLTPSSRPSNKATPPVVSTMLPLSSPLWSMPMPTGDNLQSSGVPRAPVMDYLRAPSPWHPHQTPPVRNFVGNNSSWISQAPFAPWVASPQSSALDTSARFPFQLPITESVQLTPVKESVPHSFVGKHVSPASVVQIGTPSGVATGSSVIDVKKITSGQSSADPKPRKRKKTPVSENLGQNMLQSQSQTDSVTAPTIGSLLSTSVAITNTIGFVSKITPENIITSVSPMFSTGLRKGGQSTEQRANLSEETLGKLKEARVQAENAAVLAAAAVSHSQEIWSQLDKQRISGLLPDVETKLASAAVTISAAAAVAKAAASAANVASNAALQAKLMADEAIVSGSYSNPNSLSDGMINVGKAIPTSILTGNDRTNGSSSILVAAKEAARRRVEAASAASKQAENMDAIVKAAELAAEAVSQAGKIVAMGDPLSLSDLMAARPEGYCKVTQLTSELVSKAKDVGRENLSIDCAVEIPDTSGKHLKEDLLDKRETHIANRGKFLEGHERTIDDLAGSVSVSATAKNSTGQKGRKASDSAKLIGVIPESESGSRSSITDLNEYEKGQETLKEQSIKEGSLVEVFRDGNGFKAAWFSANVLSLKDGKAYVSYTDLTSGEGLEKLKEWVALTGEGDKAPAIRITRPITAMPFEGTRKRRRAAMGDYKWSVGDRVDAWILDSWREGVITEKNKKDETVLTVHFPVQGEKSEVKAWHLRPSLVWKDGEWVEWSSSKENDCSSHGGDMPQEKRQRLRSPVVEVKEKDKTIVDTVESNKHNEPTLLELSADEKKFNIGKSGREGNKPDMLRKTRTGLQREGSKVIFGVPKPGKKRKFMEVSKHYVGDIRGKTNEASDSVKFTKFLIPQGTGSRGWKNTFKVESLEKRAATSKSKGVKSGKDQNVSGRTIPQKGNLVSDAVPVPHDDTVTDHFTKIKDSLSHGENTSGRQNVVDFQSFSVSEGATDVSALGSSLPPPSDTLSSKKSFTVNAKPERPSKGKLVPTGGKLGKIEEDKIFTANSLKSALDVEPRRSNRRIQPTSRLLEGLQSSLMVSKIPSDKSYKNRGAARGNNNG